MTAAIGRERFSTSSISFKVKAFIKTKIGLKVFVVHSVCIEIKNYRGIFIVPILSIIFEKLLKNRITHTLTQHMSHFQNGGSKGKGVIDNLFLLRTLIDHSKYMDKQLCITFYDIEKCVDSLWLED